ncbi:beta-defensin 123 [Diceros bicornis minor]|uniref:beta-defensin 123 n=1 Tax=Diceros bicornis minor TaxID=77932 RepID=UPI0026F2B545|nr:beta-defensin 123 [Diceros bicornis minor]
MTLDKSNSTARVSKQGFMTSGGTQKCWNLRGRCRHKCSKKERIYVYCTNNKMCCVKPKYQPREKPWSLRGP